MVLKVTDINNVVVAFLKIILRRLFEKKRSAFVTGKMLIQM